MQKVAYEVTSTRWPSNTTIVATSVIFPSTTLTTCFTYIVNHLLYLPLGCMLNAMVELSSGQLHFTIEHNVTVKAID